MNSFHLLDGYMNGWLKHNPLPKAVDYQLPTYDTPHCLDCLGPRWRVIKSDDSALFSGSIFPDYGFYRVIRKIPTCLHVPKSFMNGLNHTHRASVSMLSVNGREEDTTTTSRPIITIYPTASTESIIIPIISCIVVVPILIATFILLLRQGNHFLFNWFRLSMVYTGHRL